MAAIKEALYMTMELWAFLGVLGLALCAEEVLAKIKSKNG
jgi:hypothetical protein